MARLEENVAAAQIALSDDQFDTLAAFGVQNARSRMRRDRLRWRVLHGASQTVGEQSRELCRVLRYAPSARRASP